MSTKSHPLPLLAPYHQLITWKARVRLYDFQIKSFLNDAGYNNFSSLLEIELLTPHCASVACKLVTCRISLNSVTLGQGGTLNT